MLLHLRAQAFTPFAHLRASFLPLTPPQLLNQAPPGAQQLILPDFQNVPHFGHIIERSTVEVTARVLVGVRTKSSRSGFDLVTSLGIDVHAVCDIEPEERPNMSFLLAFELTHPAPQSSCLNAAAFKNIVSMLVTRDTSHCERSQLNFVAC